jgi:sRNA-binding protein
LFPALFAGAAKPIKLRIQADIEARAPGVFPKPVLTAFLRRYTAGNAYLRALAREPHRLDLDGQPAGEIAEEHREAAKKALAEAANRARNSRVRRKGVLRNTDGRRRPLGIEPVACAADSL